jgi:hypothetical protein
MPAVLFFSALFFFPPVHTLNFHSACAWRVIT